MTEPPGAGRAGSALALRRLSLLALLAIVALVALALAAWMRRRGHVTLRTADPRNPIEVTLDTRRLLSIVDVRLPQGSGQSLVWRGDPSWFLFTGLDEGRWVNPWRSLAEFSNAEWQFSPPDVWAAGAGTPFDLNLRWVSSPTEHALRITMTARASGHVGPVQPMRLFLTPVFTEARFLRVETGGPLVWGGLHPTVRASPLPGAPGEGYTRQLHFREWVTLSNPRTGDHLRVVGTGMAQRLMGIIEWDPLRSCPVVLWESAQLGRGFRRSSVASGEHITLRVRLQPASPEEGDSPGPWEQPAPPGVAHCLAETRSAQLWSLPPGLRPYPGLEISDAPSASHLRLLAPRGGTDIAMLYLRAEASQEVRVRTLADWLSVEATRCVDIDALQDPDGALGLTPEILIPLRSGEAIPVTPAGQGILLTAHATRELRAHSLATDLVFAVGSEELRVPVTLEIAAWEMPARPTLRSAFELHAEHLRDTSPAGLRRWAEVFAANRLSVALPPPPRISGAWGTDASVDWSAMDASLRLLIDDLGMTTFCVPLGLFGVHGEERDPGVMAQGPRGQGRRAWARRAAWSSYLRALREHLRPRGWLDEAVLFLWDEPNATRERRRVYRELDELIARAHAEAPEIPIYISTTETLAELEAAWPASVEAAVSLEGLDTLPADGRRRWLTLDGAERSWITGDLARIRAVPSLAWQHGLVGIEHWAVNAWHDPRMRRPGILDPIETDSLAPLGPLMAAELGGQLLFQDSDGHPLRSLAWVMLGQGMEDVEILAALRRLGSPRAQALLEEALHALAGTDVGRQLRRRALDLLSEPPKSPPG